MMTWVYLGLGLACFAAMLGLTLTVAHSELSK